MTGPRGRTRGHTPAAWRRQPGASPTDARRSAGQPRASSTSAGAPEAVRWAGRAAGLKRDG
eukprot:5639322-Pyramimonas_sp.AAC.1